MNNVKRRLEGMTDDELTEDRDRIQGLLEVYPTTKVDYAVALAVAAIDDELYRRKMEATNE